MSDLIARPMRVQWYCEACKCDEAEIVYMSKGVIHQDTRQLSGKMMLRCSHCGAIEVYSMTGEYWSRKDDIFRYMETLCESENARAIPDTPRSQRSLGFV